MPYFPYGGAGGGGLVLSPHTEDGDSIAHWEMDGDTTSSIDNPGKNIDSGVYYPCNIPGRTDKAGLANGDRYYRGVDASPLRTGALTYACALWVDTTSADIDIIRYSPLNGALGEANNIQFRVEIRNSDKAIQVSSETGAGATYQNSVTTAVVPLNEWFHFAFVRNAAETGGNVYINGTAHAWSHTSAPTGGSGGRFCVMNRFDASRLRGNMYSLICKDIEASTAQVQAMQTQMGLG